MKVFNLPDLGEGLPDAEIHEWHVKEGDHVEIDQLIVSMETAKAVVEVPSPFHGKVIKLYGEPGDVIDTGSALIEFEADKDSTTTTKVETKVGAATVAGEIEVGDEVITESATGVATHSQNHSGTKAIPAVRALANKLGVDLNQVDPSGQHGEATLDDVIQAGGLGVKKTNAPTPEGMEKITGVRRTMAQVMSESHAEVVPVVIVDDADINHFDKDTDITARVIQAIAKACEVEPALNAHYHGASISSRKFTDVNIGLAMDSGDGLFVPVVKQAQALSGEAIRNKVNTFKEQVSTRTIPPEDLQDATISLSNFGTFAGRYANPVVVPPSVAIIGIGRYRKEVVAVGDKMEIHRILPISVSFDHRAATGGEASRFLKAMIEELQK